jgi:lipoprotein-anchoring transpeptidase ErfK/SrfK
VIVGRRAVATASIALLTSAAGLLTSTAPAMAAAPVTPSFAAPTATRAWVAHVITDTDARSAPSAQARVVAPISTRSDWVHGPVDLLVLGSAVAANDRLWLEVRLPVRPNDASGWIPYDDTQVSATPWRVQISVRARTLTVYRAGAVQRSFGVVVGKPSTPTPHGLFAIYAKAAQPRGSELGPWALHLTAHSNTLLEYGGGPGRVAIHGRDGPLLADPIGSARSHGCVRADDANVSWLAAHLGEGTPVLIS